MADQFIGEIRYFPYMRGAPQGWLPCDGSTQQIADYEQLGALLGATYGGDGSSTFGLPDLRGRVPIGTGTGYPLGQQVGSETVTLNTQHLPTHNHFIEASTVAGTTNDPAGQVYAAAPTGLAFYEVPTSTAAITMGNGMTGSSGQGLPHDNCAPTMPIQVCICASGVWPTRNN